MGLPRYHEQPVLLLMYRTIQNLDFIDRHKQHNGPFEVTQLINSFLAVVAHPWDQLLDQKKLEMLVIESEDFAQYGFPLVPASPVGELPAGVDPVSVTTAYDLLRVLRNGVAHGNMELLSRKDLRSVRQTGPLPRVEETEIAGLQLWNKKHKMEIINWTTALNIHELRQTLTAMMRLCEDRDLWQHEIAERQAQREAERRAKRSRLAR